MSAALIVLGFCLAVSNPTPEIGAISGVVVNGSQREEAVANAEVVLRVIENGASQPLAQTTTDEYGRFTFDHLPVDAGLRYLPGANLQGVHYPGQRVRLTTDQPTSDIRLVVFETVAEPSPLIAKNYELTVRATAGVLEITERMLIANPTRATYVGKKTRKTAPVTLRLSLPADFESVTFHDEFHGRSFFVLDGKLMTDIPWPPGQRQISFTYRIPIEHRGRILARALDLPCSEVMVRVESEEIQKVACNLPTTSKSAQEICFEQSGQLLPAGHQLEIQLGKLPVPIMVFARWIALAMLVVLIIAATITLRRRRDANALGATPDPEKKTLDRSRKEYNVRAASPTR